MAASLTFASVPAIDRTDTSSRARHWAVRRRNTNELVAALIAATGKSEYEVRRSVSHNCEGEVAERPLVDFADLDSGVIYPRAACLTQDNPQYCSLPKWLREYGNRPDLAPKPDALVEAIRDLTQSDT